MMLTALAFVAIVTQDQVALRAAPRESAQQQVQVYKGDALEVRGEKMDYLQVYDHRHERAGYIRASQVKLISDSPDNAPALLEVVRFLRDTPGAESLGIAYAAAYLKAAPTKMIDAEPFDALGSMAERLARNASAKQSKASDAVVAAQLEVAASYGVTMQSFERDGRIQQCYNGDAFQHVMTLPSTYEQRARAVLAMTRSDCIAPTTSPLERNTIDAWRAGLLEKIDITKLPEYMKNRIHMRRAAVWSSIAYERSRAKDAPRESITQAGERAMEELTNVNKQELAENDNADYTEAALRVGASRWAAAGPSTPKANINITTTPGQAGETCISLVDAKHDVKNPLLQRCTFGTVWAASASANPQGNMLTLAVQPLEGWRELWVFRNTNNTWNVDVLPPNLSEPDVGYIEFAGWVPGAARMLVAREARTDGHFIRSFEVLNLQTMEVEKKASTPTILSAFTKWQSATWKGTTVSVR